MKTTIDLPEALLREAQEMARAGGTTLRAFVEDGLRTVINRRRSAARFTLPDAVVDGNGLQPGARGLSWPEPARQNLRRPRVIAIDTNILVYAHRRDSPFHDQAAPAVRRLAESLAAWAIAWPSLHEFSPTVTIGASMTHRVSRSRRAPR